MLVVDDLGQEEDESVVVGQELPAPAEEAEEPVKKEPAKKESPQPQKNTGNTGANFGKSVEDKFKLSLLQVEKRFIDIETSLNEVQEKISGIDLSSVGELTGRMDDVEDLLMVEQAGIIELKKMLEEVQTHMQKEAEASAQPQEQQPTVTQQEVKQWMQPLESRLHQRISSAEKRLQSLANLPREAAHPDEVAGLRARIDALQSKLGMLENMKAEIEILRGKVEPASVETLKSIMNELSDQRIETSREIREIKEKIGNAPLYADIQFLSNRVKDVKLGMDTLLNMKVEIDSKILNLERVMAEGGGQDVKVYSDLIEEVESTRKDIISHSRKLTSFEGMITNLTSKLESMHGADFEQKMWKIKELAGLYDKTQEIYADTEKKLKNLGKALPANIQENFEKLQEEFTTLQKDVRKVKDGMAYLASEEVAKLQEKVENLEKEMKKSKFGVHLGTQDLSQMQAEIDSLNNQISIMNSKIQKASQSSAQVDIEALHSQIDLLQHDLKEVRQTAMKRETKEGMAEDVVVDLQSELKEMKLKMQQARPSASPEESEGMHQIVDNLQNEMKQVRAEMEHAISRMQGQAVSKTSEQVESLKKRITDLEDNIQSLHEASRVTPVASGLYDEQINELLHRLMILESRIAAMGQMMERKPQSVYRDTSPRPIILE